MMAYLNSFRSVINSRLDERKKKNVGKKTEDDQTDNEFKEELNNQPKSNTKIRDQEINQNNIQTFAFEVLKNENPTVEFKSGWQLNDLSSLEVEKSNDTNITYNITTNAEHVEFELPSYVENEVLKNQVDVDYLIVQKVTGSGMADYIRYEYSYGGSGINLNSPEDNKIVINETINGKTKRTIRLNTELKDASGNIITANIGKKLEYLVTIRYSVRNKDEIDYSEFYKYFDNNKEVSFYQTTYKMG